MGCNNQGWTMSLMPTEFTLSGLSVELNIGQRTLAKRLGNLPPHRIEGRRRFWRLAEVVAHLGACDDEGARLDPGQERARLDRARRVLAELEAAVRRGELIPETDVSTAWGALIANARQRLLTLPTTAAPLVVGAESIAEIEATLRELVHEALAELSADCLERARACQAEETETSPRQGTAAGNGTTRKPAGGTRRKR